MSTNNITIINKYKVFNMFDQYLVENIIMFYIPNEDEVLYVTKEDHVFKYHSKFLIKTKYDELTAKQVCKFASSFEHYIALTNTGSVYSWGSNKFGELGDGTSISRDNPKVISALVNVHIVDICCGHWHSLVLADSGQVYAFGFNTFGQIGNFRTEHQLTPFKVNLFISSKVKTISCGLYHSTALTEDGQLSVWGSNSWGQLGVGDRNTQLIPTQLSVPRIKQLICDAFGTILLSFEGDIYFCGLSNKSSAYKQPIRLNKITKFIEIAASIHCSLCVALSVNNKCYTFGKSNEESSKHHLTETEFGSIEDTFATLSKPQITYKSFSIPSIKENVKYSDRFEEMKLLGNGGFGLVYKAKHRKTGEIFAVKKVYLRKTELKNIEKEVNFLSHLKSSFTVRYIDSWIEDNYYIGSFDDHEDRRNSLSSGNNVYNQHFPLLLHVQMELCPMSMKDAISKLKLCVVNSDSPDTVFPICYYIATELFVEIVECVQYLHQQTPPIIHRDLKPDNILLTNFANFRFVKLADFGLSTVHENDNQSHTKDIGTKNYRAPEVSFDKTYSVKADIYSLGIIFTELHHSIARDFKYKKLDSLMHVKANKGANNLMNKLITPQNQRPNCEKILAEKHHWLFTNEEIIKYKEFEKLLVKIPKPKSIADNFNEFFVQNKYMYNQSQAPNKSNFVTKLFATRTHSK